MFSVLPRLWPSLPRQRLGQRRRLLSRDISFLERLVGVTPPPRLLDTSRHKLVYEFKYIVLESGFLKLQYSIPAIALCAVPLAWYFTGSLFGAGAAGVSCGVQFVLVQLTSKKIENTVGKLYVNAEDKEELLFSSLDKKGRRIDRIHRLNELWVSDFNSKLERFLGFLEVKVAEPDVVYKLNVRNCVVHEPETFSRVFGYQPNEKL